MKINIAFLDHKKKEAFLLILLFSFTFVLAFLFFLRYQKNRSVIKIEQKNQLILPAGWTAIEQGGHDSLFKMGKETDDEVKPTVILASPSYNQDTDFTAYVDDLIDDTKSTIPSLQYTASNTLHQNENSARHQLTGHYYNSGIKINLDQEILIRQNKLYTITASYPYSQLNQADANQIILTIVENLDLLTSPNLLLVY